MIAGFVMAVLLAATHQHAAPQKGMRTPTVVFDARVQAWRVWVEDDHVLVSTSADRGKSWRAATRVTPMPETVDANGESRPKIALGPKGEVYVSWTRSGKKPYTGDIRFGRSLDGGRTFDAPRTINDDGVETGHRFDALLVAGDGTVHLAWIDKRDLDRAKAANRKYDGAALYHTFSHDRGAAAGAAAGKVQRATMDGWKINGCPHHGPSVAVGPGDVTHMVWFTGSGPAGAGTFYGRLSRDGRRLGNDRRLTPTVNGHAVVHVRGPRVVVIWKENDAATKGSSILSAISTDGGATFGPPRTLAKTGGASDHPLLAEAADGVYLSWFAAAEGHRLMRVESLG